MRVPWKTASLGKRTTVKAELVDLYRTLADLAGIGSSVQGSVQGTSLAAVFDEPAMEKTPVELADKAAFSQIGRCVCGDFYGPNKTHPYVPRDTKECGGNACCKVPLAQFNYMGYSMRTADMRFTAWVPFDNATLRVDWNHPGQALELFDLSGDDGRDFDNAAYSANIAADPARSQDVNRLLAELKAAVASWY